MKTSLKMLTACCLLLFASTIAAQTSMDYTILIEDIEFQPGVTIDINVNVYVNENAHNWANHGKIFAIEGMAHTANCLKPLAEELFTNPPQTEINEFYAIDMPGRGGSGLPEGEDFLLDEMYIEDYLEVIQGAIAYLNNEMKVFPNTIMGHSLGGLEVILLQNKLIKEGTNLRQKYGIKNAVLLAPGIPAPLDWAYINGGGSAGLYQYIDYFTPEYGTVLNLPYYVWPFAFFTNTCCYFAPDMVPGAPTPAEVLANGYNSIEPAPLLLQVSGAEIPPGLPYPYKPRKEAEPNIFRPQHGVQLTIVCDEFDKMMLPEEELALYEYLTGDKKHKRLFEVLGEETCHDTHISNPGSIVELLDSPDIFKSSEVLEPETVNKQFIVYPNPVENHTTLTLKLQQEEDVSIQLFNSIGQKVETLFVGTMKAGSQSLTFDLNHLSQGVYFIKLETGNSITTNKLLKN
jgi:pimeloyl-ACP methyl ester carboxylesterase